MIFDGHISSITHTTVINAVKSDNGVILTGGADRVIRRHNPRIWSEIF